MELSLAYELYLKPHLVDTDTAMKLVSEAGFRYVDMSVGPFCRLGDAPFLQPDWQRHAENTVKTAEKYGITMKQAHCLLFNYMDKQAPDYQLLTDINLHLMDVCKELGVEYFVLHPGVAVGAVSTTESLNQSAEWISLFAEKAEKTGVKVCIENIFDTLEGDRLWHTFGVYADELVALADKIGSDKVGFCWDTGHAHIGRVDQRRSIGILGDRLWTTHVHDNRGQYSCDLHLPPFYGSIDWQSVMQGLKDVNYKGTFNFELEPHTLPFDMMGAEFKTLYHKGERLLEMMK